MIARKGRQALGNRAGKSHSCILDKEDEQPIDAVEDFEGIEVPSKSELVREPVAA